jgi:hypothetical protein
MKSAGDISRGSFLDFGQLGISMKFSLDLTPRPVRRQHEEKIAFYVFK